MITSANALKKTLLAAAALAALTAASPLGAAGVPVVDDACEKADRVVAPPGAILVNWKLACVKLASGATLTWTHADAAVDQLQPLNWHGARFPACEDYDLGAMRIGQSQSATLEYDAATGLVTVDGIPCAGADVVTTPTHAVLPYDCVIHGSFMPGKIVIAG